MTKPVVLNVNDHVANLYLVSKLLSNAGYRVLEARTGQGALEVAYGEQKPDVIVLDVHLPDISGIEVCRRLKADPRTQQIKILHTSATFVTSNNKLQGVDAGADGYLTQPFEPEELIATIRSLVRLRATEADLTQRNEALLAEDRRKDEFLAMLGHELRNPLAAVQMGLEALGRYAARDASEARTMAVLHRQTALLTHLVDDLLDVSRVTRGRITIDKQPLDLGELVRSVASTVRARVLEPRQQTLHVVVPDAPVRVAGDAARLEQVLTNLLDNASKYADPGTPIEVSVSIVGDRVKLEVIDRGIGIAAEMLSAVFDLFAQAKVSLARSRGGLGIGLTLVRSLVELHGGEITADSAGLGKGTTMTVHLPLDAQPEVPAVADPPAAPRTARKVALIDDNEDGRQMLRMLCESDGHEVVEADDGPDGVELLLTQRPDVAFVDIGLPTFDGYEVARRVRAAVGDSMHLVALTGYGTEADREQAKAAGFDAHVAKPIQVEQLRRAIAKG